MIRAKVSGTLLKKYFKLKKFMSYFLWFIVQYYMDIS